MFREDLTDALVGSGVDASVEWLVPDPKAGCVRFGLSDGRVGNVKPGDVGGWKNTTIYVGWGTA